MGMHLDKKKKIFAMLFDLKTAFGCIKTEEPLRNYKKI